MSTLFGTTPDYRRLLTALQREVPDRVPFFEAYADPYVQLAVLGDWPQRDMLPQGGNALLDAHIRAAYYLGYDCVTADVLFPFPGVQRHDTVDPSGTRRNFLDVEHVPITSWADFERYPWPAPERADFSALDYLAALLPDGMQILAALGGGALEWSMWMMGPERFCTMLYDDPALVEAVISHVGTRQAAVCAAVAGHPAVCAIVNGDDWGFRTQTFLAPADMRRLIFPEVKRLVEVTHAQGKPFILHSCGNLTAVMDGLIDEVGIDGKHSFEENVTPVTEAKARWGDRLALCGGIDIDMLCRADDETLRGYVRRVLDRCAPGGGFLLGSGNSIPNFIPPRAVRIMLEEGARWESDRNAPALF